MQIKPNHVYETPNYKLQEAMKRIKNGRSCFTPGTDSGDDSKSFGLFYKFYLMEKKNY